jgi:hypothetical protein
MHAYAGTEGHLYRHAYCKLKDIEDIPFDEDHLKNDIELLLKRSDSQHWMKSAEKQ